MHPSLEESLLANRLDRFPKGRGGPLGFKSPRCAHRHQKHFGGQPVVCRLFGGVSFAKIPSVPRSAHYQRVLGFATGQIPSDTDMGSQFPHEESPRLQASDEALRFIDLILRQGIKL